MPTKRQHLKSIFGNLDLRIKINLKYFTYRNEHDDFKCNACSEIVKINQNANITTLNFTKHLDSDMHKSKITPKKVIKDKIKKAFGLYTPKLIEHNLDVLGMQNNNVFCLICNKYIQFVKDMTKLECNFAQHLESDVHQANLETHRNSIRRLESIYGKVPTAIIENAQYFEPGKNRIDCTICNVQLTVDLSNLKVTEANFMRHLESEAHASNRLRDRVFSRIPQLKQIYSSTSLPSYILLNIDYLNVSANMTTVYCSLCDESLYFNPQNLQESLEEIKHHTLFSINHEINLKDRKYNNEEIYSMFTNNFDKLSEFDFVYKFNSVSIVGGKLVCKICKVNLSVELDQNDEEENVVFHLISTDHDRRCREYTNCTALTENLVELFGNIPSCIEDDLEHLEFKGDSKFECTLCHEMLRVVECEDYEELVSKTEDKFSKHFESDRHVENTEEYNGFLVLVEHHLRTLLCFPSELPKYLLSNLENLGFKNKNVSNNFLCHLCDVEIHIAKGPKTEGFTLINLKTHLQSPLHLTNMRNQADNKCVTMMKLKDIFGGVSSVILNNIVHLEKLNEDSYQCQICDAKINVSESAGGSEENFHSHLLGQAHQSGLNILEKNRDAVLKKMKSFFRSVPECVLKNLDYLKASNEKMYCTACQVFLPLQKCCLSQVVSNELDLQNHFESKPHNQSIGHC